MAEVISIKPQMGEKIVETNDSNIITKVVIIAGGSKWQKMNIPGEDKYIGKGVSYCATCDAAFFKDQPVAVVGGGDSAVTEALHLAKFATKVTIIHRREQLRATKILQEKAFTEPKIEFLWDSIVTEIEGQNNVQRLKLHQVKTNQESTLQISGVFISIGLNPNTDYLKDILPLDDSGHVITNNHLETGTIGIFAAGDIRQDSARQAITASGDGATAAIFAKNYLI
jgi:thioredoxin reductase (NADPH)